MSLIRNTFDDSVGAAENYLSSSNEQRALATWRMTLRGKELTIVPRLGVLRSIMLNHWCHHRGQLSVYLRLLDVPVPVLYGCSAVENPFA